MHGHGTGSTCIVQVRDLDARAGPLERAPIDHRQGLSILLADTAIALFEDRRRLSYRRIDDVFQLEVLLATLLLHFDLLHGNR